MRATSFFIFMVIASNLSSAQDNGFFPDYVTTQYAGSIGTVSLGAGYEIKERSRVSVNYGFVPVNQGGELHILSGKYLFTTVMIEPSSKFSIQPLNVGAMLSYQFGDNFYVWWPADQYPNGYYWWPSALRFHLLLESAVTYKFQDSIFSSLSGYVEFNTNDLYLNSYILNVRSLSFFEIIKTGVGVRLRF